MCRLPQIPEPVVVLVEDDAAVRNALRFAIELEGFATLLYESGEALMTGGPLPKRGCLVIDYLLPGMNGVELFDRLRADGNALPAIFMTTNPSPLVRAHLAAASVPIVEKPLLTDALVLAIKTAIAAGEITSKD